MLLFPSKGSDVVVFARMLCLSVAMSCARGTFASVVPGQSFPEAYGDLAKARASIDHHEWALADMQLRQYLTQHEGAAEAMYLLAMTLLHENHPQESLTLYTRAAAARRPAAQDFHFIALDYVLLQDYTDADKWITQAVREDPNDGEIAYAMGRIKYTENRFAEAVTSFERALVLMPRSVKAENNLGLTFEGLNEADKAVLAYRQAIAWQAGDPHPSEQPLLNLGNLFTDRNQLSEALPLLQQAEALAPADSKIHTALGKLYARQMDYPAAQKELEQALRVNPRNAGLHFQLGQVYRKEGQPEKAKEELTRAAALEGTHSSDAGSVE